MKNEFIPYKEALALKELGFDEECFMFYNTRKKLGFINKKDLFNEKYYKNSETISIMCPLYQQVFRWFREEHNLIAIIYPIQVEHNYQEREQEKLDYSYKIVHKGLTHSFVPPEKVYENYTDAQNDCIIEMINIIKDENN